MRLLILSCGIVLLPWQVLQAQETRLLRFPTIHEDNVVFTYAGNLYTSSSNGGIARRLTSHEGFEMFPRFSPDGKTIAFTGQYDGNTEVYTIPSEGGTPRRLTYTATLNRDEVSDRMGPNNIVIGWKSNGKEILFRSRMHSFNDFIGQLFTVNVEGGLPEPLPLPRGGFGSYSPDDSKLVYNRIFREFRTWKRYRGGMADEVWIYDFKSKTTEAITKHEGQDIIPMWAGNKIYFLSDRDDLKRFNLWTYDLTSKTTRQVTRFSEFDCKFPSLGKGSIVFENGGYIYRLSLETEKTEKISIQIKDDILSGRGGLKIVSKDVTTFQVAPDGKRALFGSRGDVFTIPATTGQTRNLTNSSGIHERNPVWSPDGKQIAMISDQSGEDEIVLMPQDGSDLAKPATSGSDTYKYEISFSPDSKKILWSDKKLRLQFIDLTTKKITLVDQARAFEIRDYVWSPDSKWIAFTRAETDSLSKLYLYSIDSGKSVEITDGWYSTSSPCFSNDGKYLYFVSSRDFTPLFGTTEFNHSYFDMSRIYFVILSKETPNPFKPKSDEVFESTPPVANATQNAPIKVDLDGIKSRLGHLPIPAANYRNLQSASGMVYYLRTSLRESGPSFNVFDMNTGREVALGSINGFEIAAGGNKMLVTRAGNYGIIDLPRGPFEFRNLNLNDMEIKLDRHAEWRQIFNESWRQMHDFLYDPNLHGVDWLAVRKKYESLLPHVQHRADLTYVIGEMISELNVGHAYVNGGDLPTVSRISTGLLGAQLKRDPATKYYQIIRILPGENWIKNRRSPLTEIGVDVKTNDYIVAINGTPTNETPNIYELLLNTSDKQITLQVNQQPHLKGSRSVVVTPIADESQLYYYDWVQTNIKKVNEASNGKIGYIHIPDMVSTGLNEFVKHYYPQLSKKALLLDLRGNGGGNVSPQIIERLRREIAMFSMSRNTAPSVEPSGTFWGPMACLINEYSASDGDLFPYRFKHYNLGPLIGKRTWGGVVGIRNTLPFVDGGDLRKPEFSRFDIEGKKWIIEGYGVDPDIVQDNDPAKEFAGEDEQLLKGIQILLEKLKTEEKKIPELPPFPKR